MLKAVNHQKKCPICRSVLPYHGTNACMPVNILLEKVLKFYYSEQYSARATEEMNDSLTEMSEQSSPISSTNSSTDTLPIFVLDAILPRQQMALNVFEPRYVLMVERCLQSSRRFGMIGVQNASHRGHRPIVAEYGTEVEITDLHRDGGRFQMMVTGRRPFKIVDHTSQDGYMVANVEWLKLDQNQTDRRQYERNVVHVSLLHDDLEQWTSLVRTGGWERRPGHLDNILEQLGPAPRPYQPDDMAFWIAALINPLPGLGLAPEIRGMVLAAESTAARITILSEALLESTNYITPSSTNIALQKLFRVFGAKPSQPLLRCILAILPWVIVGFAVFLRSVLVEDHDNITSVTSNETNY